MKALFIFLTILTPLSARDVAIAWDPNPEPHVDGYRVYVRPWVDGEPGEAKAWEAFQAIDASPEPEFRSPDFPEVKLDVAITAFDADGFESELSESLTIHLKHGAPVKLRIVQTIEENDGSGWTPAASQIIEVDPETGRKVFKTILEPTE